MNVIWLPQAQEQYREILETIRRECGDVVAAKWQRRIFDSAKQLESLPQIGMEVPEIRNEAIREVGFAPYRVIYRLSTTHCHILAVIHSRQHLTSEGI